MLFLLRKPTREDVGLFLAQQDALPFSYSEVGASRFAPPPGYKVDHNRVQLGVGPEAWVRATQAVREWKMFNFRWLRLLYPSALIRRGVTVGILVKLPGLWSLNACRVVYLIEEDGLLSRYGFAYGTLPGHAERGEERFSVEWHHDDDTVWYDVLAFSSPNGLLPTMGYPLTRVLQRRFARDSMRAMMRAVEG